MVETMPVKRREALRCLVICALSMMISGGMGFSDNLPAESRNKASTTEAIRRSTSLAIKLF